MDTCCPIYHRHAIGANQSLEQTRRHMDHLPMCPITHRGVSQATAHEDSQLWGHRERLGPGDGALLFLATAHWRSTRKQYLRRSSDKAVLYPSAMKVSSSVPRSVKGPSSSSTS
ncbi:hypothetical protein EYF80_018242 [Liparis tanakae]|uniref:Uncharacterized protein n=1 Tax=Liparis tanakae TaxID=230148 RepID=A0A4Z2I0I8_9TELE|nr:hypothetical protein EYF80_018242 [Liparis tanakae]